MVRGSKNSYAKSAYFAIFVGDSSLEALMNCGFKLFCRLDRAIVKLLDKECSVGIDTKDNGICLKF